MIDFYSLEIKYSYIQISEFELSLNVFLSELNLKFMRLEFLMIHTFFNKKEKMLFAESFKK